MLAQELKRLTAANAEPLLLLLIFLIAIFLRFYDLAATPPIVLGDEMRLAWTAMTVLEGEHAVFFEEFPGALPLQIYLEAAAFRVAAVGVFTARAVSAVTGVVTVIMLYVLVKRLFGSTVKKAGLLALLSSFLLATSYWHLVHSRMAAEPALVPFFAVGTSLLFWRAIESQRTLDYVWAGLLLGLSMYSYAPAQFLPLVTLSFLAYRTLLDRASSRAYLLNTTVLLCVAFMVVLPLVHFALNYPDAFFARSKQVSILNAEHNQGNPLLAFLISTARTIGMFSLPRHADWHFNPAGRAILDPVGSVILLVGLALAVRRYRQPAYFFVVLWLIVMCLPSAVTIVDAPSYNRAIGAAPAVCILMAIGIGALGERVEAWHAPLWGRRLFWPSVVIFLLWTGTSTFHDYFTSVRPPRETSDRALLEAGQVMNTLEYGPDAVWIVPAAPPVGWEMLFTLESLYGGNAARRYMDLDEVEVESRLERYCQGYAEALVVDWKRCILDGGRVADFGDAKGRLPFLLTKYGQELEELEFENFNVLVYQLPAQPSFSIVDDLDPANVPFGQELKLVAVAMGGSSHHPTSTPEEVNSPELPSGRNGWVVLRWKAESMPSQDYKVGVYLVDQRGRRVAQADKVLLSNYWEPSGQWEPGQEEIDYYTLSTMAGTPPGWYDIQVVVYNEETMERLPVLNGMGRTVAQTASVGRLQVVTPLHPAVVQPAQTLAVAEASVAPDISLLGYDIPTTTLHPGDTLSVALYWKALRSVHGDYVMSMQLNDQNGRMWAEEQGRPVYGTYPTTEWAPGEVLRDWHDLTLEPSIPGGSYQLELQVREAGQVVGKISLGAVEVSGRARRFQIPEMQHALGLRLGEPVTLLGYDLRADRIQAGETLALTLYWQALTQMDTSYTVFTHLLDQEGRIWGQKDSVPGGGQLPTTSWVEREIIEDWYEIEVSRDAPAGEYVLEIGMYQWETGERLPVFDERGTPQGDRILLDRIQILR